MSEYTEMIYHSVQPGVQQNDARDANRDSSYSSQDTPNAATSLEFVAQKSATRKIFDRIALYLYPDGKLCM